MNYLMEAKMMLNDSKYQKALKLLDHYKAIGFTEIPLDENDPDLPWDDVVEIADGGTFRFNVSINMHFIALHNSGMKFRWYINLEPHGSNGSGTLRFDTDLCVKVYNKLLPHKRKIFAAILDSKVAALQKQAEEYSNAAAQLIRDAATLKGLALV